MKYLIVAAFVVIPCSSVAQMQDNGIESKTSKAQFKTTCYSFNKLRKNDQPLLVVNQSARNQKVFRATKRKLRRLDPESIDTITIFKGDEATSKYGKKGRNGVIVITMKIA